MPLSLFFYPKWNINHKKFHFILEIFKSKFLRSLKLQKIFYHLLLLFICSVSPLYALSVSIFCPLNLDWKLKQTNLCSNFFGERRTELGRCKSKNFFLSQNEIFDKNFRFGIVHCYLVSKLGDVLNCKSPWFEFITFNVPDQFLKLVLQCAIVPAKRHF